MSYLAFASLILGCVYAHGGLQNGDFSESGLPGGFSHLAMEPGYTDIAPWEIVPGIGGTFSGSVEYINAWSHDPGGACVELGYYYGTNGIRQTFDTVPNREYEVRFWMATDPWNGPRASVRVLAALSFADYVAAPGTANQSDLGWTQKSFRFVSDDSGHTTLLFHSLIGIAALDSIEVNLVRQPPVIHSMNATPPVLWPPNHKLVPVRVSVRAGDDAGALACRIVEVTSNEPVSHPGVKRRAADWQITGPLSVELRAERSGTGVGRIYTITVECEDEEGNRTSNEVAVMVPTSQPRGRFGVDQFSRDSAIERDVLRKPAVNRGAKSNGESPARKYP